MSVWNEDSRIKLGKMAEKENEKVRKEKKLEITMMKLAFLYMELEGCSTDEAINGVMEFILGELKREIDWVEEMLCK